MENYIVVVKATETSARRVCERIENNTYPTKQDLINFLFGEFDAYNFGVYKLTEYMDMINDDVMDMGECFITYVNI